MTFRPHPNEQVYGYAGPSYRPGPQCAVAHCGNAAADAHHLWRRSAVGKHDWVELWNGDVVQNLVGLCWDHHGSITRNETRIAYVEDAAENLAPVFMFIDSDGERSVLVPQPKTLREFQAGEQVRQRRPATTCPTCGHRTRADDLPAGERRNRASWNVHVPMDERENGATILDTLVLAAAEKLQRAHHKSYKYFTLVEVLVSFVMGHIDEELLGEM